MKITLRALARRDTIQGRGHWIDERAARGGLSDYTADERRLGRIQSSKNLTNGTEKISSVKIAYA